MSAAINLLKDFQAGPLDYYRKLATFNWKKLKVFIEGEEELIYKYEIYKFLENDTVFRLPIKDLTLNEERQISHRQLKAFKDIIKLDEVVTFTRRFQAFYLALLYWNHISTARGTIHFTLFTNCIRVLGTERHQKFIQDAEEFKIFGCFALTEVAHGSNTKGIQTVAKYDKDTQEFVINTPNFQAAKCWVGNLGKTATHACLYARLITPNNTDHGLHSFIVPIRDTRTTLPYPGIIIGDMGEKIGLRGIDNGFMLFKNYRIPRDYLLNKMHDVAPNGEYIFHSENTNSSSEIFSVLIGGRVNVANMSVVFLIRSIVIAIRYCGARRQSGKDNEEMPILEYPTTQLRIIPHLASSYILIIFGHYLIDIMEILRTYKTNDQDDDNSMLFDLMKEMHAISSAGKCVCTWLSRDGIQECREVCEGFGYLKAAGIGTVREDNDAYCTLEGDNHVLIQQTSNWLLKSWDRVTNGETVNSPLHTVEFLNKFKEVLKMNFDKIIVNSQTRIDKVEDILSIYRWLICWYLKTSSEKLDQEKKLHDNFTAKNNIQVYFAFPLALVFSQYLMLSVFYDKIKICVDTQLQSVLTKLFIVFGCYSLENSLATLYQGGAVTKPEFVFCIRETISTYCLALKNEAISLVDVISPPDIFLNSVLGNSDGQIYDHIEKLFYTTPGTFERPQWWRDVVQWKSYCDNLSQCSSNVSKL